MKLVTVAVLLVVCPTVEVNSHPTTLSTHHTTTANCKCETYDWNRGTRDDTFGFFGTVVRGPVVDSTLGYASIVVTVDFPDLPNRICWGENIADQQTLYAPLEKACPHAFSNQYITIGSSFFFQGTKSKLPDIPSRPEPKDFLPRNPTELIVTRCGRPCISIHPCDLINPNVCIRF